MKGKLIFCALALCLSALTVLAQEQRVQMKDLPAAVKATVQEQSKGAKMRGLSKEREQGKTVYELELIVNGHSKDMIIDESGAILEVEEQIALNALPAAVKAELEKQAGKGKIQKVESVTKGNTLVYYEGVVKTGKKATEIKVSPDGTPVK
ncbi:MAG: hypothetical protein JST84_00290 [Acidobacteria bacterium]|nr:hypothetical protein [Acidobacteriota bacterium]